jgi:hypothetical protein
MASISGDINGANINQVQKSGAEWSEFPAIQDVNFNNKNLLNCGVINWSSFNPPLTPGGEGLGETLAISNDASLNQINNIVKLSVADADQVNSNVNISQISGLGNSICIYNDGDILNPIQPITTLYTGGLITTTNTTIKGECSIYKALNVGNFEVGINSNINLDGALIINEDGPPVNSVSLSAGSIGALSNSLLVSGNARFNGQIFNNYTTTSGLQLNPADGYKFVSLNSKSVGALGVGALILTNNSAIPSPTADLECRNITCNTLNYTSLNPSITPGGNENLSQTLTIGNDAGGQNITNLLSLFAGSIQGTGANGLFQIGNNNLNNYVNDNGGGTPELTLGFCQLNMAGNKIINLDDPVSSDEPATKNYVDNLLSGFNIPNTFSMGTINTTVPNTGAWTVLLTSNLFSSGGKNHQYQITFNNIPANSIFGSPANSLGLTGRIGYSPDGSIWNYSFISPYDGFRFTDSFLGWISVPSTVNSYYIRIEAQQTIRPAGWPINSSVQVIDFPN